MVSQEETYNKFWSNFDIITPDKNNNALISQFLNNNKKVLEIGPGVHPSAMEKNMYFLDISNVLEEKYLSVGCNFKQGDCLNIPFKNEEFDLVVAFEIFEHIKEDEKALKEINRILKKNSWLFFSVPINDKFWTKWDKLSNHIRRYDIVDLSTKLKNSGYRIEQFKVFNTASKIQLNTAAYLVKILFFLRLKRIVKRLYQFVLKFTSSVVSNGWETENLIDKSSSYEHIVIHCKKI